MSRLAETQVPRQLVGWPRSCEEVSQTMRKLLALTLVAGLALGSAFALGGCTKKESTNVEVEQQPTETMQPDTTGMMTDTTRHDSM